MSEFWTKYVVVNDYTYRECIRFFDCFRDARHAWEAKHASVPADRLRDARDIQRNPDYLAEYERQVARWREPEAVAA